MIDSKWFTKVWSIKHNAPTQIKEQFFIERAREVHGDKYDYSMFGYVNTKAKVIISCLTCSHVFHQLPTAHLKGQGCPSCAGVVRLSTETFVQRAILTHGHKYKYDKVNELTGTRDKVTIVCPLHGDFSQLPLTHIGGQGCPRCSGYKKTTEDFISEMLKIHDNNISFEKTKYINAVTPVTATCKEHGDFLLAPKYLLRGQACPSCSKQDLSTRGFYIITTQIPGVFKLGITNDVRTRIRCLNNNQYNYVFKLHHFFDLNDNIAAVAVESYFKIKFSTKRFDDLLDTDFDGKTELFILDNEDIADIFTYVNSLHTL